MLNSCNHVYNYIQVVYICDSESKPLTKYIGTYTYMDLNSISISEFTFTTIHKCIYVYTRTLGSGLSTPDALLIEHLQLGARDVDGDLRPSGVTAESFRTLSQSLINLPYMSRASSRDRLLGRRLQVLKATNVRSSKSLYIYI